MASTFCAVVQRAHLVAAVKPKLTSKAERGQKSGTRMLLRVHEHELLLDAERLPCNDLLQTDPWGTLKGPGCPSTISGLQQWQDLATAGKTCRHHSTLF
jgi:hypothetical protein